MLVDVRLWRCGSVMMGIISGALDHSLIHSSLNRCEGKFHSEKQRGAISEMVGS